MSKVKLNKNMYQDKASGIWYFQKRVKGRMYKFSLETKAVTEARKRRGEYLDEIRLNGCIVERNDACSVKENSLFGEIAMQWADIKKTKVAETTFHAYQKAMNTHVLPYFGNMPIEKITSLEIEKFLSSLKCSSKTKLNIYTPFKGVMGFSKKHKIINTDPTGDVDTIKVRKSQKIEHPPLSLAEFRIFIDCVDEFWKPMFVFMFFTGVRISETAGLKWKRVDFKNGVVQIHRNIVFVEGKRIYKETKTDGSHRNVKLNKPAIDALIEQKKRTHKGSPENFVFLNKVGRNVHRHTLNKNVIKPTLEKAGLSQNRSIKDTRASYITNCLDKGERMSYIIRQVGHANTNMLIKHYYRWTDAPDDGNKLEEAWGSTSALPETDG